MTPGTRRKVSTNSIAMRTVTSTSWPIRGTGRIRTAAISSGGRFIATGPSVDADYSECLLRACPGKTKLTAEIRLQGGGDVFEWIIGGYYEESTDCVVRPVRILQHPVAGSIDQFAGDSLYARFHGTTITMGMVLRGGITVRRPQNWSAGLEYGMGAESDIRGDDLAHQGQPGT